MSNKITKWIIYGFSTTIVFSVLMLLAYFFNFYYADFPFTLPIPLSRDNAEWGNFGSFISGVFGFVSAMATVFTLLYIAKQHKEIMTLQEKVTADQKYLAAKQLEVIAFEKHEKHLAAFISNCIEIEGIVLNQLEMKYKRTLYKDIFYDNSYKNTDYTVSIFDKNSKLNLFIKFFEAINKEITYLNSNFEKNELCNRKINNLIHDIYCLSAYMYIEFNDAVQDNGSIYYGTAFPSLNIFMVKKQLNQLHQVLEQLTFFLFKK
ncbi:hypothetical protein [Shewanella marina]|uniref:hypothetical protein n=1 Tax=Shewanella marina TaxID=487319 RepID=UPI00046F7F01|nr:hypothetical protein [Shewanella marina]